MNASSSSTLPHRTVALFALWLLLSQSYTFAHMAVGIVVAFAVARLNTDTLPRSGHKVRWLQAFAYIPWLFTRIVASGVHLSYLILHPRLPIDPKIIHQRTRLESEAAIAILGNSITLTPGTLTLEANSDEIVVHALDDDSTSDVTSLRIENKIAAMFVRGKAK